MFWLSIWRDHDLSAHVSESFWLKKNSLARDNPETRDWEFDILQSERLFLLRKCFLCDTDVLSKASEFPLLKICWANWIFKGNNYILNLAPLKEHARMSAMLFINILSFPRVCHARRKWRDWGPRMTVDFNFKRMRKFKVKKKENSASNLKNLPL